MLKKATMCILFSLFATFDGFCQNFDIKEISFRKYNDCYYLLDLPYIVSNENYFVFASDTPLAINIIGIFSNGERLSYTDEVLLVESRTYFNLAKTPSQKEKIHMTMWWKRSDNERIYWHDGRGIIFNPGPPGNILNAGKINCYELKKGMQNITIRYKILFPYPNVSINDLYEENQKEEYYSDEYVVSVNLDSIWEELHDGNVGD
jgi:hypothetical protein